MTTLRTRQRWVASDTDDCLVRRAIVERLAPHGHWVEVPPETDPKEADRRDLDAQYLAERWEDRPEVGYAAWTSGGPTWVQPYVDGERWTMIPAIKQ